MSEEKMSASNKILGIERNIFFVGITSFLTDNYHKNDLCCYAVILNDFRSLENGAFFN